MNKYMFKRYITIEKRIQRGKCFSFDELKFITEKYLLTHRSLRWFPDYYKVSEKSTLLKNFWIRAC